MPSLWDRIKATVSYGNEDSWSNPAAVQKPGPPKVNISMLNEALRSGRINRNQFVAAISEGQGDGPANVNLDRITTNRNTQGQFFQPAAGAVVDTIFKVPGNLANLGGGLIEAATPFNSQGQALQRFGARQAQGIDDFVAMGPASTRANPGENRHLVNIGAGAGSLAASLAMAGAGGANVPSAVFGINAAGEQFQGAKENGLGVNSALAVGIGAGAAEAALEKIGLEKVLGAKGNPLRKLFIRALSEGPGVIDANSLDRN